MERYARSHLANQTLLDSLATHLAQNRGSTAELLADLAEIDERKLYRPAGYESMYEYCVGALHLSEDAAFKRIRVARAARQFPAIFAAVAEGRLSLNAVVLLAPHLTPQTADELLAAATHKRRSEIERLLAERFPRPDVPTLIRAIAPTPTCDPLAARPVGTSDDLAAVGGVTEVQPISVLVEPQLAARPVGTPDDLAATGRFGPPEEQLVSVFAEPQLAARPVQDFANRARVTPLSPGRFAVQFTLGQQAHDRLRYAQELLSHEIPPGDLAATVEWMIEAVIPMLERRKFAATPEPRPGHRASRADTRHIPAEVKRAVWERDGAQCTFVSQTGHRCTARTRLEFDHVQEFARGGEATVSGIQLRCRAHNQFEAERTFGAEFMRSKRLAAAEARAVAKAQAEATERQRVTATKAQAAAAEGMQAAAERTKATAEHSQAAVERAAEQDVVPWLRALGISLQEARRAAEGCEHIPDAPLDERVKLALSRLGRGRGRASGPGPRRAG